MGMRETLMTTHAAKVQKNIPSNACRMRPPREPQPGTDRVREPRPTPNPLLQCKRVGLTILFAATLIAAPRAHAQDAIVLSEIIPALAGSELGRTEIAPAPRPGASRIVRRSEVLRALRDAGHSARGLDIPRSTRIDREARRLDREDLRALVRPAILQAYAPCQVGDLNVPARVTMPAGEITVRLDTDVDRDARNLSAIVVLQRGSIERRVSVRAPLQCPPPPIRSGSQVRVMARVGNVVAFGPGRARQPGRVGDVIRVHNEATHTSLMARVISPTTVEVVQ